MIVKATLFLVVVAAAMAQTAQEREQAERAAQYAAQAATAQVQEAVRATQDAVRATQEHLRGIEQQSRVESYYRRGVQALDERQWERAMQNFDWVARQAAARADGALYWKAYAQHKLGRRTDALAVLEELQKSFPSSRWLNDAKALALEVRQASGQPVSPEAETDEEIKLVAISGLMSSDPERALPLAEKMLQGSQSPRVKERVLFVLSQSQSPRAREIVMQVARGGANPDLQVKALQYAGHMGKELRPMLAEVYASHPEPAIRRAVIRGLMALGDRERIFAIAKEEKTPEVRREAIQQLGNLGAQNELWQLYAAESSVESKQLLLQAIGATNVSPEKMLEIARTEKDPALRREAIHNLGHRGAAQAGEALISLYASETDLGVRREILGALRDQNNAKALIDIARKETNPTLKKEAVRRIATLKSKEAVDYMLELVNK